MSELEAADIHYLAWAPTPHVIGTQGHNHTCAHDDQHGGPHACNSCGQEF